jgi:hypothetical protein
MVTTTPVALYTKYEITYHNYLIASSNDRRFVMYDPFLLSKMAHDHHKELLEVTNRERMLSEMLPTRTRHKILISLAVSTPIALMIFLLMFFA